MFTTYIRGVIRIMTLFLFGSTGEIITEKPVSLALDEFIQGKREIEAKK